MALMRFNSKTFLPESAVKQTQVKGIMAGSHLGWCSSTAFSILTDKQAFSKLVYINMLKKNPSRPECSRINDRCAEDAGGVVLFICQIAFCFSLLFELDFHLNP